MIARVKAGKWSLSHTLYSTGLDHKTEKEGLSIPLVLLGPSLSLKCKKILIVNYFYYYSSSNMPCPVAYYIYSYSQM